MASIKIAAAQLYSVKGNIEENIKLHLKVLDVAAQNNVDFIIFPELSLTGYELELSERLAVEINEGSLLPLGKAAEKYNITIAAGMPIKSEPLPKLGLIIFSPNGDKTIYNKMNIHTSEDEFFANGDEYKILNIKDEKIALAICADINNPNHIKTYKEMGATIYAASVLISENGYPPEIEALHNNAKKYDLPVLLSNHNKPTGKYIPAGKSGIFLPNGTSTTAGKYESAIILAEKKNGWQTSIINLEI